MAIPWVFFDESGQTYYNYLDLQQRCLAYGALRATDRECQNLKSAHFGRVQAQELHYVDLRKRGTGQAAVKSFLKAEAPWIEHNFKWFFIDKRYALLAKYVDILIEPEVAALGDNLYSGGGAQTLVYLLHHFAQLTENEESLSRLMTAFSNYARDPSEEALAALERTASTATVGKEDMDLLLRMPFVRKGLSLLRSADPFQLDLSFTAAFTLAEFWYQELNEPFCVIHDDSRALSSQIDTWRNFTQEGLGYQARRVGSYEMPVNVPLRETLFVSSASSDSLQIVDVILGAYRSLFEWAIRGRQTDPFLEELEEMVSVPTPTWSIGPWNDPSGVPEDSQSVEELDQALREVGRKRQS